MGGCGNFAVMSGSLHFTPPRIRADAVLDGKTAISTSIV
jgi:hypothetical protein